MNFLKNKKLFYTFIRITAFILGAFIFVFILRYVINHFTHLDYNYFGIQPILLFIFWAPVTLLSADIFSKIVLNIIKKNNQLNMFLFKKSIVMLIIGIMTASICTFFMNM